MSDWELPSLPRSVPRFRPAIGIEGQGHIPSRRIMPLDILRVSKMDNDVEFFVELTGATPQTYLIRIDAATQTLQIRDQTNDILLTEFTADNKAKLLPEANGEMNILADAAGGLLRLLKDDADTFAVFGVGPVARQDRPELAADGTANASVPYTGIDNTDGTAVYATVADLNALATAYNDLRTNYLDIRTKMNQLMDRIALYGWLKDTTP